MSKITEGEASWKEERRRILASEERYQENYFTDALIDEGVNTINQSRKMEKTR